MFPPNGVLSLRYWEGKDVVHVDAEDRCDTAHPTQPAPSHTCSSSAWAVLHSWSLCLFQLQNEWSWVLIQRWRSSLNDGNGIHRGAEGVGGLRSPSLQLHWWWGLWQLMVHPSTSSSLPPAWSEEGWWLLTLLPCSGCRNRGPQMGWFKQQKFIVSQFWGLGLVLRGLSPQLVGGHLLTVSSFAFPSVGLSPDLLFL